MLPFSVLPEYRPQMDFLKETPQSFGINILRSKYAQTFRHKTRKYRSNYMSGNKRKLRNFVA